MTWIHFVHPNKILQCSIHREPQEFESYSTYVKRVIFNQYSEVKHDKLYLTINLTFKPANFPLFSLTV